jgi:hypothetical protein
MLLPSRLLSPLFRSAPRRPNAIWKREKYMKNVVLSVLVVLVLGAAVVATLSIFEITKKAAELIAGMLAAAIPTVHQLLQKSGSRLSLSARKRGVVSLQGYTMPVVMLALYGILILWSASELMGALAGVAASAAGVTKENFSSILALAAIPQMIVAYFVGRWIGVRSQSKGLFAVLAVGFFAPFIDWLISHFAGIEVPLGSKPEKFESPRLEFFYYCGAVLSYLTVITVKLTVPALLGYWRGRGIQLSRYLVYLLRALPQDSQNALVNLASDEAKRLASSSGSELSTPPI